MYFLDPLHPLIDYFYLLTIGNNATVHMDMKLIAF